MKLYRGAFSPTFHQTVSPSLSEMKVAHQAGTEIEFSKNVDGVKVAHQAGTEPEFSKNVDGMRVAHQAGWLIKLVQSQNFPKMSMG